MIIGAIMCAPLPGRTTDTCGSVLFHSDPARISVPFGNFRMIRSAGKITQYLRAHDAMSISLYTDRDNRRDGYISGAGLDRTGYIRLNPPAMGQGEFIMSVMDVLTFGDSSDRSGIPFPGLDGFHRLTGSSGTSVRKRGTGLRIIAEKAGGGTVYTLDIDYLKASCTIKITKADPGLWEKAAHFPVVVAETEDTKILGLIRKYFFLYRESLKK